MQSFAVGLSRIGEGVLGTVGSYFSKAEGEDNKETKKENPRRNIEYIDEVSTGLYPDLHYSEIVGTHKSHDEDDFLLLENTEVPLPSCPYYYVPFNQSVDMCNTFIRNWLQTIWFLPADWKTTLKILPGRPCLVPFYVFDVKTHSQIEAEVQIDSENGTKQWKSIADSVSSEYREMITCASRSVNQKLIDKLLYSEEHGFSFHSHLVLPAQLYPYPPQTDAITVIPDENVFSIDISKEEAWELSKLKIEDDEKQKSQNKITSPNIHSFRNMAVDTEYDSHNSVVYLPIYFASYEYTGQIYEVLVSGNKGVVVGSSIRERPIGTGSGGKFIMDKLKSLSNLVTDTVPM